jgi:hypothetical protein
MTKDEALRLALEAFEYIEHNYMSLPAPATKAITAIKAALEAKDEPVAWISPTELLVMRGNALGGAKDWRVNVGLKPEDGDVGLYTTPPQRNPLTDEEIHQIFIANSVAVDNGNAYMVAGLRTVNITRAIEAKLKEKNT